MRSRLAVCIVALLCASLSTHAQLTPANTLLSTFATASYTDGTNSFYAYSNTVSTNVSQTLGVAGSIGLNYVSAAQGTVITIPVTVTNTGNGFDTFTVAVPPPPTYWNVYVLNDSNADGVWQSSEWESLPDSGLLDRGQSKKFFLRYEPPWGDKRTDGVIGSFSVVSQGGDGVGGMSTPQWDQPVYLGRNAPMYHVFNNPTPERLSADVGGDSVRAFYAGVSASMLMTSVVPWQGSFDRITGYSPFMGRPGITTDRVMWVTTDGRLTTFDKVSKKVVRTITAPSGASFLKSPTVYGTNVLVPASGGVIHLVSRDGVVIGTSYRLTNQIKTEPVVVGTQVLVGTDKGEIACFDANTLALKWLDKVDTSSYFVGRMAMDPSNKVLIACTYFGKVYAYNIVSRYTKWSRVVTGAIVGVVTTKPSNAFVLASDRKLHGWDINTGNAIVGYPLSVPQTTATLTSGLAASTYASTDGTPYVWFNTTDGYIFAANAKNGLTYFYQKLTGEKFYGTPGVAANKVTVGADRGWVYGYDPR